MRLWTAMLGAWLAAGTGGDVPGAGDRVRAVQAKDRVPVADRPARAEERPRPEGPDGRAS